MLTPFTLDELDVLAEWFSTTPQVLMGFASEPKPVRPQGLEPWPHGLKVPNNVVQIDRGSPARKIYIKSKPHFPFIAIQLSQASRRSFSKFFRAKMILSPCLGG